MSRANLIYQGKVKLIELANTFVIKDDHGMETECLETKIMHLKSLIQSLEGYIDPASTNGIDEDFLYLQGEKILLSPNNPYICALEDQTTNVNDVYLNCLTEEELCDAALKLRMIINS